MQYFYTLRALGRKTAHSSADPIGENASAFFSSGPLWRAACSERVTWQAKGRLADRFCAVFTRLLNGMIVLLYAIFFDISMEKGIILTYSKGAAGNPAAPFLLSAGLLLITPIPWTKKSGSCECGIRTSFCVAGKNKPPALQGEGRSSDISKLP